MQSPLHLASRLGDIELAKQVLRANADVNARDERDCTPLQNALQLHGPAGREMAMLLLACKADANTSSSDFTSPLFFAAEQGDVRCPQENGQWGRPDAAPTPDVAPNLIVKNSLQLSVVEALIAAKASAAPEDRGQFTPLLAAAQAGHAQVVHTLLAHSAAAALVRRRDMCIPLCHAVRRGHTQVCLALLAAAPHIGRGQVGRLDFKSCE